MSLIIIVLSCALLIFLLERLVPHIELPKTPHWWLRAGVLNSFQGLSALAGAYLWDAWFAPYALFSIADYALWIQVTGGYLLITFVYYWWHRARHQSNFLWRHLHQLHHSPQRIEVATSFYKHPTEIVVNGMLSSAVLYLLLGASPEAVGLSVLLTALAELVYHMNIRTPYFMGWLFQRPEMHRVHHQRGLHHYNYSDLPLWDMLFGTYLNPRELVQHTGFPDQGELRLKALLKGQELAS